MNFKGSGGGGGGSNARDSLFSTDAFEFVLGISEGPIGGIDGDTIEEKLKNIYIDDTAVYSTTGKPNFSDSKLFIRFEKGTELTAIDDPDMGQTPIMYAFKGATVSEPVNLSLSSQATVTKVTSKTPEGYDQIELRFYVSQLVEYTDNGSKPSRINMFIEYREVGEAEYKTTFLQVDGKTTVNGFVKSTVITVPRGDSNTQHELKVTVTTEDSNEERIAEISWASYELVQLTGDAYQTENPDYTSDRFEYHAGNSMLHVAGVLGQQLTNLPNINAIYKGLLCAVPSNYDPVTKTYDESTSWDGTFLAEKQWTDNPFWIAHELITNIRFGAAKYNPLIRVNRFSVYEKAKYADGYNPISGEKDLYDPILNIEGAARYTYNAIVTESQSGMGVINQILASAFSIAVDNDDGEIQIYSDMPALPTITIMPEMCISPEGGTPFSYTFSDITGRHNAVTAKYIDKENKYQPQVLSEIRDEESIAKHGYNRFEFDAVGTTSAWEADRKRFLYMRTAQTEIKTISFTLPMLGYYMEVFDVIAVVDPDMGNALSGRSVELSNGVIRVRDPLYFAQAGTYDVTLQGFDQDYEFQTTIGIQDEMVPITELTVGATQALTPLRFDGSNDRLSLPVVDIPLTDTTFTWVGSFAALLNKDYGLFQSKAAFNETDLVVWYDDPQGLVFFVRRGTSGVGFRNSGILGLSVDTVYKIELTIQSGLQVSISVYLEDGTFVDSATESGSDVLANLKFLFIGDDLNGYARPFKGDLKSFTITDNTTTEILHDYRNTDGTTPRVWVDVANGVNAELINFGPNPWRTVQGVVSFPAPTEIAEYPVVYIKNSESTPTSSVGLPKLYRIANIEESGEVANAYQITATEVNPNKHSDADLMENTPVPQYSFLNEGILQKVTGLQVSKQEALETDTGVKYNLVVSWDEQTQKRLGTTYEVEIQSHEQNAGNQKILTSTNYVEIDNVGLGQVVILVRTRAGDSVTSPVRIEWYVSRIGIQDFIDAGLSIVTLGNLSKYVFSVSLSLPFTYETSRVVNLLKEDPQLVGHIRVFDTTDPLSPRLILEAESEDGRFNYSSGEFKQFMGEVDYVPTSLTVYGHLRDAFGGRFPVLEEDEIAYPIGVANGDILNLRVALVNSDIDRYKFDWDDTHHGYIVNVLGTNVNNVLSTRTLYENTFSLPTFSDGSGYRVSVQGFDINQNYSRTAYVIFRNNNNVITNGQAPKVDIDNGVIRTTPFVLERPSDTYQFKHGTINDLSLAKDGPDGTTLVIPNTKKGQTQYIWYRQKSPEGLGEWATTSVVADEQTLYDWTVYANSDTGTDISVTRGARTYIGISSGHTNETPELGDPSIYTWVPAVEGVDWLTGSGAPSNNIGKIRTKYLDLDSGDVYTKTGAAEWTLEGNLSGGDGDNWFNGVEDPPSASLGKNGDNYLVTGSGKHYEKVAGSWSLVGVLKGDDGTSVTVSGSSIDGNGDTVVNFSDGSSTTISRGADGIAKGVKAIYATNATGTSASFTEGTREFINLYEWTGTAPTTVPAGLTYARFKGTDGTSSGVVPIYATNSTGTSASYTRGSRTYVNFYEWTGTKPATPPTGLSYLKMVGIDGVRGAGHYYTTGNGPTWDETKANGAVPAPVQIGDRVTISNGSDYSETKVWTGTWEEVGAFIDSNLLVNGNAIANKVFANAVTVSESVTATKGDTSVQISAVDDYPIQVTQNNNIIFAVKQGSGIFDGGIINPSSIKAESLTQGVVDFLRATLGVPVAASGGVLDSPISFTYPNNGSTALVSNFVHGNNPTTISATVRYFSGAGATAPSLADRSATLKIQRKLSSSASGWVDVPNTTTPMILEYTSSTKYNTLSQTETITVIENQAAEEYDYQLVVSSVGSAYTNSVTGTLSVSEEATGGATSSAEANNAQITLQMGSGLSGGGNFTLNQIANETIDLNHADPQAVTRIKGGGGTSLKVVNYIATDGKGHVHNTTNEIDLSLYLAAKSHSHSYLDEVVAGNLDVNSFAAGSKIAVGSTGSWSNRGPQVDNANGLISLHTHSGNYFSQLWFDTTGDNFYHRTASNAAFRPWAKVWTDRSDGEGSGLDADLLDGYQASDLFDDTTDYRQIQSKAGNGSGWVRTPSTGLLPSNSGGASNIGSASWNFLSGYFNTLYEGNQALSLRYLGINSTASNAAKLDNLDSTDFLKSNKANGTPIAAYYLTSASGNVGTKIRLPFNTDSSKMVAFTVRVYQGYQHYDVVFSGYLYSDAPNNWYSPKATMLCSTNANGMFVRMGRDADGRAYVWLAGSNYRGVAVMDVVGGYRTGDWNTGWDISESDSTPNLALDTAIYPPYSPHNPQVNITGNAGSVSGGVYTTGNQTISGVKTFSSTIAGSISGNAGSVTNGVYTSDSRLTDARPPTVLTIGASTASLGLETISSMVGYTQGIPSGAIVGTTSLSDGALYANSYSTLWRHQIIGDYRTGRIAVRGRNNGVWQPWLSPVMSGDTVGSANNVNRSVNAGTGLSGGGTLTSNVTLNAITSGNVFHLAASSGRVVADCNAAAYRESGFYGFNNLPTNGPSSKSYLAMMVARNSDVGFQLAGGFIHDEWYARGWSASGTYRAWKRFLHDGNALEIIKTIDVNGSAGINAGTFDSLGSGSFLRSDVTDYINGLLYLRNDIVVETGYRNRGVFGTYDPAKTQHIWSMGTNYRNAAGGVRTSGSSGERIGSPFGNMYGASYYHPSNGEGTLANGHQFVWCENGVPKVALGQNIWTAGDITALGDIYGVEVTETSALKYKNISHRVGIDESLRRVVALGKKGVAVGSYKDDKTNTLKLHFIADEAEEDFKEAVKYKDGEVDGLSYTRMLPDAYAAIAKQQEIIERLMARVEMLEAKLNG